MMDALGEQIFTTPDGLSLAADVAGRPDQPAVVLLHGGGQTRHSWSKTQLSLALAGYYVVNYDARGHGDSGWSPAGDYSVPTLADDLASIRKRLGPQVVLVGASMGGITSFYTAGTRGRDFVSVLIMVDIALRPDPNGVRKIHRFMTSHGDGFGSLEEAADAVAAYKGTQRPDNISGLRKNLRRRGDGRWYWHWDPRLMENVPSPEPPLATSQLVAVSRNVVVPTLLIRGGRSDVVTDEVVAEMLDLVPQTEVCEVAAAAHMVAGDDNDRFNERAVSFLASHMPAENHI